MAIGGRCGDLFQKMKPYIAMVSLQFGYAGMNVITKVSLNHGMSHYVLVVYRHAFATLSIAPSLSSSSVHVPDFLLRDEQHPACNDLRDGRHIQDGEIGHEEDEVPGEGGGDAGDGRGRDADDALQGTNNGDGLDPARPFARRGGGARELRRRPSSRDWFLGSMFLIIATLAWASLFILQAVTLKQYSAQLSLTTLICFVGTLQAIVVTFVVEHKPSVWTIGFDMNLLAAAYAGIVTSSIAYYVQGLVIEKRGPVFASAFSPLMMIIVAIMGSFILAEKIYLGGVLGAVLIVMGLYSVLWGKYRENKEQKENESMALPMASKGGNVGCGLEIFTTEVINGAELESKKPSDMNSTCNGKAINGASAQIGQVPLNQEAAPKS
uniref:WAT1-related protein n=1 Tax=Ananas comosus var. bracteatus TaxID=296719 RepID=A0A6V7PFF4_ANACO|nr:unnamed protein product [Ananas comosus var. bracteatus]